MNVTKLAETPVTFEIKISETEKFNVWGYPNKVTQKYLDKRAGIDYPLSRILPEVVQDWDLTYDVEVPDEEDIEESGTKKKSKEPKVENKKVPLEKEAIDEHVPLWLQNMIWQEIFQYNVPNLMKSNP